MYAYYHYLCNTSYFVHHSPDCNHLHTIMQIIISGISSAKISPPVETGRGIRTKRTSTLDLRIKNDDVIVIGPLIVTGEISELIVDMTIILETSVKSDMKDTSSPILTRGGNENEASVGEAGSFGIERSLIKGVKSAIERRAPGRARLERTKKARSRASVSMTSVVMLELEITRS